MAQSCHCLQLFVAVCDFFLFSFFVNAADIYILLFYFILAFNSPFGFVDIGTVAWLLVARPFVLQVFSLWQFVLGEKSGYMHAELSIQRRFSYTSLNVM